MRTAVELLKQNPDKINWFYLSHNTNKNSLEMLKQNPDKIIWGYLSRNINPEAVEMLKKTPIRLTGIIYHVIQTPKR
jgi:ribosomal protein L24E